MHFVLPLPRSHTLPAAAGPTSSSSFGSSCCGVGNQISFLSFNELPKGNLKAAPEKVAHELQYSAFVITTLADRGLLGSF